jgi:YbbR domain-containing protein
LFLWIYVSSVESPTSETSYTDVAVAFEGRDVLRRDYELSLITTADFTTEVKLSGKKSVLNQIERSDIKAYIDLSSITEAGKYDLPIQISAPDGTAVSSYSPHQATVVIDKNVTVEFPIEANITYSNLPSAYTLGECVITDTSSREIKTVWVSGPKSEIDSIHKICATADFGDVESSVETKTNLVMYNNLGEGIISPNLKLSVDSVKVKLPVYMQKILKLSVEQAYNTFSDDQIIFRVSPSTIAVSGDPKVLTEMDTVSLAPINEKTIGTSYTTTVNTLINLPEGMTITSNVSTARITATLVGVNKNTVTVPASSISVKNLKNGLKCRFNSDKIVLTAINSSDTQIDEKDVTLTLDMTNYTEPGTYTHNVSASVIDRINHAYIVADDYPVTFTISEK